MNRDKLVDSCSHAVAPSPVRAYRAGLVRSSFETRPRMADTAPIERECVAVELVAQEATEGAREGEGRPVLTAWDCREICVL